MLFVMFGSLKRLESFKPLVRPSGWKKVCGTSSGYWQNENGRACPRNALEDGQLKLLSAVLGLLTIVRHWTH